MVTPSVGTDLKFSADADNSWENSLRTIRLWWYLGLPLASMPRSFGLNAPITPTWERVFIPRSSNNAFFTSRQVLGQTRGRPVFTGKRVRACGISRRGGACLRIMDMYGVRSEAQPQDGCDLRDRRRRPPVHHIFPRHRDIMTRHAVARHVRRGDPPSKARGESAIRHDRDRACPRTFLIGLDASFSSRTEH
jgi:hypothetical protein